MRPTFKERLPSRRIRTALIDADSILYAVGLSAERRIEPLEDPLGEVEYLEVRSKEDCFEEVCTRIEELMADVRADEAIVCLTPTRSFRYSLLPTYKAQRKHMHRPGLLLPLQAMLEDRKPFTVLSVRGLEADDVCGISQGTLQATGKKEPVIVSIDKDLKQIPGLAYSWLRPEEGVVEVTEAQADWMHYYQTLVGDSIDNYTGCPGVGPKKAERLLAAYKPQDHWKACLEMFKKHGSSEDYALTQARVARILRATDWDSVKREVKLWSPITACSPQGSPPRPQTVQLPKPEDMPSPGTSIH